MSEKYNIPELNSLDSMEGVEKTNNSELDKETEISPEIEGIIMSKVEDIFEDGKAYHVASTGKYMFQPRYDFESGGDSAPAFVRRIKTEKNIKNGPRLREYRGGYIEEITQDNIREYFENESLNEDDIEKFFTYGIMSNYLKRDMGYDENGKIILPDNYKDYRAVIKDTNKKLEEPIGKDASYVGSIYFTIQGRQGIKRKEALEEWSSFGSLIIVFKPPEEEIFNLGKDNNGKLVRNKKLKFGQYSTSHYSGYDDILYKWLDDYPDLKPNDPRIKKLMERDGIVNDKYFNERNQTLGRGEGFILPFRISPKKYEGLVVTFDRVIMYEDVVEDGESDISEQDLFNRFIKFNENLQKGNKVTREKHLKNKVKRIVRIMLQTYKENPEMILPIYDSDGNMLWPEEMSNEEIVKMKNESVQK